MQLKQKHILLNLQNYNYNILYYLIGMLRINLIFNGLEDRMVGKICYIDIDFYGIFLDARNVLLICG